MDCNICSVLAPSVHAETENWNWSSSSTKKKQVSVLSIFIYISSQNMWCSWSPEASQGQIKQVILWEHLLCWILYFSFYPAESEQLLSKGSEEVSEAVRKGSGKAWGKKMCLYSEDPQNAFRVLFVCGRILQESWHRLGYETGKCVLSQRKWEMNGRLHSSEAEENMQETHGKNWADQGDTEQQCSWPGSWSTCTTKTLLLV